MSAYHDPPTQSTETPSSTSSGDDRPTPGYAIKVYREGTFEAPGWGPMLGERELLRLYRDRNDWWIGYYRGEDHHYVCPLPTIVIRFRRRAR